MIISYRTENKDEICLLHVFGLTVECTRICTGVSLERRNREIKSSPVSNLIVVLLSPTSPPARPCIEKLAYSKYAYENFYKNTIFAILNLVNNLEFGLSN